MQGLIPVLNQLQTVLRTADLQQKVSLPQIVVVGAQSSGKSSVLESLVGKDFLPRGSGIVTRCPLRLQLVRTSGTREYGVFAHLPDTVFEDFSEIRTEIEKVTIDIVGTGKDISVKPIELTVFSSKVLDITLIDLPGVVKVPVGDQPPDIAHRIKAMILAHVVPQHTLIMAISAANVDLANSDALQLAREVDPKGDRTLGVLTKLDLMDKGTNALSMLENRTYSLKLGHVGVICRSQEDIESAVPLHLHLAREEEFFRNDSNYCQIAQKLGVKYLAARLNELLLAHIKSTIPSIAAEMNKHLNGLLQQHELYGEPLNNEHERARVMLKVISDVSGGLRDIVNGRNFAQELRGGARISHLFHSELLQTISGIGPFEDLNDDAILTAILNSTGSRGVLFVPEAAFEILLRRQIALLKPPCVECLDAVSQELSNFVYLLDVPEFSRFPSLHDAISEVISKTVKLCQSQSLEVLETLFSIELSFINVNHPDFIDGSKAFVQAYEQTQPNSEYFRSKPPSKNEGPTEKQTFETALIKILIDSYFTIVKANVTDMLPKLLMDSLVERLLENLNGALINDLYDNKTYLDFLLAEPADVVTRRCKCRKMIQGLEQALCLLKQLTL